MAMSSFDSFLGFGSRPIAVPVDAMVLLGQDMEIVAFTPKQLQQFPTFSPSGTTDVPDDTIISWLSTRAPSWSSTGGAGACRAMRRGFSCGRP